VDLNFQELATPTVVCRASLSLQFWSQFVEPDAADVAFPELLQTIPWRQEYLQLYGKRVAMPRLTCWFGDQGATSTYSGLRNIPLAWTRLLQDLRVEVEARVGQAFNSVLANLYRDGRDYMSWHSDDEPELGQRPTIASLSFGASHRFELRSRRSKSGAIRERQSIELTHGSLLVMKGDTQRGWEHSIPKESAVATPRINLTFRFVMPH